MTDNWMPATRRRSRRRGRFADLLGLGSTVQCGGPAGLVDGKAPGQAPRLDRAPRRDLAQLVEDGPIPAVHGVGG